MTRIQTRQAKPTAERALRRPPGLAYWLVARDEDGLVELLVLRRRDGGERVLPVFGHREEAEMFLELGGAGDEEEEERGRWRPRESAAGELVSLLYGPCAGVREVALDPLPEMVAQRTIGLVSLPSERFIEYVTTRRRPIKLFCGPGRGSGPPREVERSSREADRIASQYLAERPA